MKLSRHTMRPFTPTARGLLSGIVVLTAASSAAADSPFSGRWKQGPLKEEFTVQTWFNGCGPAPVSSNSGGGDVVTIQPEGDELAIVGPARIFRTNQCYDPLPTLARESHSRDPSGRLWRTRCATPPGDPRVAQLNTLVAATSDTHIELTETGRYDIRLTEGRCVADIKRSRGFDLVVAPAAATAAPPAPSALEAPQTSAPVPVSVPPPAMDVTRSACVTPGEPARLEVRPSRKLVRAGETFAFRSIVRDAAGCVTPTAASWSVPAAGDSRPHASVDSKGRVSVSADSPEGAIEVTASAAGKSTRVTLEVASPAHYDALLNGSGFDSSGEVDTAAVVMLPSGTLGGRDALAEDQAKMRRFIFLVIVGSVVMGLGIIAVLGWRRSRRAATLEAAAEERHAEQVREAEGQRRANQRAHAAQVRAHQESVERARASAERSTGAAPSVVRAAPGAAPATSACPKCGREFAEAITFCPHDGAKLAGASSSAEGRGASVSTPQGGPQGAAVAMRGKICPTCGSRFDGHASFCGKDGTALVLLN